MKVFNMKVLLSSVPILCILWVGVVYGGGGPSDQPISATPPNLPGGQIANDAPPGPFLANFQPPFPTDSWWSGFTVSNQDAVVAGPFPYQSSTSNEGFVFGFGDKREFDGTSVKVPTQRDWNVGLEGLPVNIDNRRATAFDTQTVCLQYSAGAAGAFDTCLVPGSPYLTFKFTNAAIKMTSLGGEISEFRWIIGQGTKALVTTTNGATYIIYVIDGVADLKADLFTLTSPAGTTATLRIARLKEPGQEAVLDAHANTYATGVDMRYNVAGNSGTITWTWETVGDAANLLLLSWPHHRALLQNPQFVDIQYSTLKGQMRGIRGNTWTQTLELPTITWFAENDPQPSCLPALIVNLEIDVDKLEVMYPGDFYFWGGSFGRAAQLATIAEHVGRMDLVDRVVRILKDSINPWFEPGHTPPAAYETGWGGFINKEGADNTWVDFGNGYYNDHHFHYGYLLHGAAVIAKYDPAWMNQNLDFINHVARDVGNPSPNDPFYTVTRHMDWFAGHSWASGIANGAGSRDQESSSEAINGYYGLLLWATVTNNAALVDYSRLILAMEIHGSKTYWHLYPRATNDATPYEEQVFRDLITVGNVMDWQAGAFLFWGAEKTQVAAIQILPVTPIGTYTYDREWMENVVPYCKEELDNPDIGDAFKSVIYAAHAKVNPQEAFRFSTSIRDYGSGNSASNQIYFISTQPSAENIC